MTYDEYSQLIINTDNAISPSGWWECEIEDLFYVCIEQPYMLRYIDNNAMVTPEMFDRIRNFMLDHEYFARQRIL